MIGRGYFIAGTPRSGSTYLCRLLTGTQALGRPEEWLDPRTFTRVTGKALPQGGGWGAIVPRASTGNGVYGVKVFASQVDAARIDGLLGLIASSTVIHLERRDLLVQALSWSRAAQTGRWQNHQSVKMRAVFAPELIDFALSRITEDNARWRLFFARRAIVPWMWRTKIMSLIPTRPLPPSPHALVSTCPTCRWRSSSRRCPTI